MRVTRHLPENQIKFDYSFHQKLEQVQSAKYLGIAITDNLDWGQHISEIACKATKTMGFFDAIWPWQLGTQRKLHTKHLFGLSWSMQHLFGIPTMKLRLHRWRRCRGQLPGGPAGGGGIQVVSAICWTSLNGHKIHSGTVALDNDKYLTPAPNIRRTSASHELQYTRYMYFAYSEALKNPFFPRTIVFLPRWSHPRLLRSLRLKYKSSVHRYAF